MDNSRTIMVMPACLLTICSVLCCYGDRSKMDGGRRVSKQEPFTHVRRAALATDAWGGMRVDWTAVADWPTGDSTVAKSVRAWIGDRLRNYRCAPFNGDIADWDAMTRFYGEQFLASNGSKDIEHEWCGDDESRVGKCPYVDPGADVFLEETSQWACRHTAIIQYEDERIVSYRAGFSGYFVRNATSAAYVKCATFRKTDGRILGWDAFSDTNAVFRLVRELAKVEFKKGANIYETGIPVPAMPLFTNEGFWCFWGDYAIVEPHVYEVKGVFPSLFIPWHDPTCGGRLSTSRIAVESLLLPAAKSDLCVGGGSPNQSYNRWGNGSAMRVSACGWAGRTRGEIR